jgi:hypothetical protein
MLALASLLLLLVGMGAAMIPWLGTGLVVFLGWIPLLMWVVVGTVSLTESLQLGRTDLTLYSMFVVTVPIAVYCYHLWIMSLEP